MVNLLAQVLSFSLALSVTKLTKGKFAELYPHIPEDFLFSYPKSDTEVLEKYLPSKLWRLNNLYTIINKDGQQIPFIMNPSQHKAYSESLSHPRLLILKSRQQGISTFYLLSFLDDCLFNPNFSIGLMANGAAEATTLLQRVKLAWDHFPLQIKQYFDLSIIKDNASEIGFSNGSVLFIRTSFRSATLQRLHISEMGKIANTFPQRAKETKTGTLQAIKPGNDIVIESTAEGKNLFSDMWDTAILCNGKYAGKDFKPVFLSWLDDPDCSCEITEILTKKHKEYFELLEVELSIVITAEQKNFWVMQYRELGDLIYQEYPSTPEEAFSAVKDGTYYANLFVSHVVKANRVIDNLYDANLSVTVAVDLGMNDTFVLTFWQEWRDEVRLIDEYTNSGEGLAHYVDVMFGKSYTIERVILPHDVKVRELSTGQSRLHRLRQLGVTRTKVLPKIAVSNGIEAVRKMIPNLWVDSTCVYSISCFLNYSKEWEEKTQNWKDKPLHNDFSHGADCIRYKAVSRIGSPKSNRKAKRVSSGFDL